MEEGNGWNRAPAWRNARAALDAHAARLRTQSGIVAGGLTWMTSPGEEPRPCISLHVEGHATAGEVPAALHGPHGPVPVRVTEAGRLQRHLSVGARIGCRGLGTGDRWGTLGMIARDRDSGRMVAVTAMHVIHAGDDSCAHPIRIHAINQPGQAPSRVGVLLRGTTKGVDAAAIRLRRTRPVSAFLPGVGPLTRCRTPTPADLGSRVRFYGAASGFGEGRIREVEKRFFQDRLDDAFLVEMTCRAGDSGGVCCDDDGAVLGLHVGSLRAQPHLQVFCAAEAALRALRCQL